MTLYIALPVLASACSVVMIAHFVLLAEERITVEGLYGDMYAYIALAESFHFFNSEVISFRFLMPLISGSIAGLFGLSGMESLGLLTGSLNFIYLLTGFGWMYYLSLKESANNSLEVALPTFLLLTLPAFWQGIFLPVPDALMFCFYGMALVGILRQQLAILLPAAVLGVWVSEWMFLVILLLPLIDRLRGTRWIPGYTAMGIAGLLYLAVPLVSTIPESHLVFQSGEWLTSVQEQFAERETSFPGAFWRSFALTLPFFVYRIYVTGWNRVTGTLSIWFLLQFGLVYVIAPEIVHRILFMVMPALVMWQYQEQTFRNMDSPLNRAGESQMG